MTLDPNSLLTVEELTTPRIPMELDQWVENKGYMFKGNRCALLHEGLFKKFFEEVFPLNLFVKRLYAKRADIQCTPNLDNRDFDAIIVDYSTSPPAELKVEITYAVAEKEYLRMEYFVEHGYVNAAGKVSSSGTKNTGHKIHVEDELYDHIDLLKQACSRIQSAVARKSIRPNAPQKYGRGHVLLVAFHDRYLIWSAQDIVAIKSLVERHVLLLPLNFAALYVVGLSGKTFIHFVL
jgi:hypothetical protein